MIRRWALLLPVLLASTMASAQNAPRPLDDILTGAAKANYDSAKLLFVDGDFSGAEIKFKAAYDEAHDARLLWNMAACEKSARHYARTVQLVHQYVDEGGALLSAQDKADAKELLSTIESFIVRVTISVAQPDAEIFVDAVRVGKAPLAAPIVVDLGVRTVVAKKAGFKDASRTITVGAKPEERVEIALLPDVHEGSLRITTAPGARIFLDDKPVGEGAYSGRVASGPHTIRIEAPLARNASKDVELRDDETKAIDLQPGEYFGPKFRGFEGRIDAAFGFGFTGHYVLPASAQSIAQLDGSQAPLNLGLGLHLGYAFGWFALESFLYAQFDGSNSEINPTALPIAKISVNHFRVMTGIAARATSTTRTIRFTGSFGVGVSIAATIFDAAFSCNNNSCPPNTSGYSHTAGYAAPALVWDAGILLGGSPGAKFFLGVQAAVDFAPNMIVGPDTQSGLQQFQDAPPNGWRASYGPIFFIGPVLGVGFGH